MKPATALLSATFFCLCVFALTGCETGRGNKLHARPEAVSDVTTIAHQNPQYASIATGIPPVPGSPTAAGPDGLQPLQDSQARRSPGSEKGRPTPPRKQAPYRFIRQ